MIRTERLVLVPAEPRHLEAFGRSRDELGTLLGASVPRSWPTFPESMTVPASALAPPWSMYFFVEDAPRRLVGSGGFKGPPGHGGVEIGYEVAEELRGRGLGSEAAAGLVRFAFDHDDVHFIDAHTLPEPNPSTALLARLGFVRVGAVDDPDEGTVWHWRLERAALSP